MFTLQCSSLINTYSIQFVHRSNARAINPLCPPAKLGIAYDVGSYQPPTITFTTAVKTSAQHASRRPCTVLNALPTRLAQRHAQKAASGIAREDRTAVKRQKLANKSSAGRPVRRRLEGQVHILMHKAACALILSLTSASAEQLQLLSRITNLRLSARRRDGSIALLASAAATSSMCRDETSS